MTDQNAQVEELASRNQALSIHMSELTNIKIELHAAYIRIENKLREVAAELEVKKAENTQLQKQITDAANPPADPTAPATPADPNAPAAPVETPTPTDTNTPATPAPTDPNVPAASNDDSTAPVDPNGNPEETNVAG